MRTAQVRKMKKPLTRLLYWIKERESIRLKKHQGLPKPWTNDEILQKYRFCNVRRMDDRVSQWLFLNWYEPYTNHPLMLPLIALARHFNKIETLQELQNGLWGGGLPDVWNCGEIIKFLRSLRKKGATLFNAAYMVRGNDGKDKIESVVKHTVTPLVKFDMIDSRSMENTWKALYPMDGFGSFMAGQVVADLRWAVHGDWNDRLIWAPIGPGSRRGMNRLLSGNVKEPMSQESFGNHLYDLIEVCDKKLPTSTVYRLEAIDYQNCLCEFDKYSRTLWKQGRPKQLYPGV